MKHHHPASAASNDLEEATQGSSATEGGGGRGMGKRGGEGDFDQIRPDCPARAENGRSDCQGKRKGVFKNGWQRGKGTYSRFQDYGGTDRMELLNCSWGKTQQGPTAPEVGIAIGFQR